MRVPELIITLVLLAASGCNRAEPASAPPPPKGQGAGGASSQTVTAAAEAVWPPPGSAKAPPPPEVDRIMRRVAEGLSTQNRGEVERYFITDLSFAAVSDCEPGVAAQVAAGRAQAATSAATSGAVTFRGFDEGYLLEVPAGGKPGPCRARQAVGLYQARYTWRVGEADVSGEAHFLRVGSVWFLVKL